MAVPRRARIAHQARVALKFGVHPGAIKVNMTEVIARKNKVVAAFRDGLQEEVDSRPSLTLYHGYARFIASHQIEVNGRWMQDDYLELPLSDPGSLAALPHLS